ncbi:Cof-type HAD-IIB family hydrolase [Peptostreptococcaceae bacterium AGR-M142]
MNYKMVVVDMDMTLLNSNHEITNKTKNIIKKVRQKGIKVVLASGRSYISMLDYAKDLGIEDEIISLNGGVITDIKENNMIKEDYLDEEKYIRLMENLEKTDYSYMIFNANEQYYERNYCKEKIDWIKSISKVKLIELQDYKNVLKPIKLGFQINEENDYNNLVKLPNLNYFKVIKTGYNFVEIVKKDTSKWSAVEFLREKYNIDSKEIIAIGDSENDLEMIKNSGLGIAMKNAYDNIKDISDYVTDTNDNNGVAKALEKFIF